MTALHTLIRDANTSRGDFVFYSNRILRLVIEEALNQVTVPQSKRAALSQRFYQWPTPP